MELMVSLHVPKECTSHMTIDENYQLLANAVVEQAANDYRKALCDGNSDEIRALERFFKGESIKFYTNVDGKWLIERLREDVAFFNHDYRAIKRSITDYRGRIEM